MDKANQTEHRLPLARPIGGWLYLLAIGAVVRPIFLIVTIAPVYYDIFKSGTYEILTTPESIGYVYGFKPLILFEIAINLLIVLVLIWQATLFFEKKKLYRPIFIGTSLFSLLFILLDAVAVSFVFPHLPILNKETVSQLISSLVVVAIWVPYVTFSLRAKETFVY